MGFIVRGESTTDCKAVVREVREVRVRVSKGERLVQQCWELNPGLSRTATLQYHSYLPKKYQYEKQATDFSRTFDVNFFT